MECHAVIVAGFGFRRAADVSSLAEALDLAAQGRSVQVLATADDKAAEPVFVTFANRLDLPVAAVKPSDLAARETRTQSSASRMARGTGSVAESAALAAAGAGARLISGRVVSGDRMATCALAESEGK